MSTIFEIADHLERRLPELEWRLTTLNIPLNSKIIPSGLFKSQIEMNAQICIDEIRADLKKMQRQTNETSALYLAGQISRKIHVLINLCNLSSHKKAGGKHNVNFNVQTIGNRQKWLEDLQVTMQKLTQQQTALQLALESLKSGTDSQAILNARTELGAVTKLLTEAKEASDKIQYFSTRP
jgi:hypothetical protein